MRFRVNANNDSLYYSQKSVISRSKKYDATNKKCDDEKIVNLK